MKIQTISIVVPTKGCINNCPFCVSRMHENNYNVKINCFEIKKRLKWAIINGVNTCIFTGTGEAFQNKKFLEIMLNIFKEMNHPFPNVEFQTTGVMLLNNDKNVYFLKNLGVNTISLSVSDIFLDERNMNIIGVPEKLRFKLKDLIDYLKTYDFNIRLSLNMLNSYDKYGIIYYVSTILDKCKDLGADQVTFRKMYYYNNNVEQSRWVKENQCSNETLLVIKEYIEKFGEFLYKLPFGASVYSISNMSVVIDDDCMSKNNNETLKYVILRENGKLYVRWDDEGSLIF